MYGIQKTARLIIKEYPFQNIFLILLFKALLESQSALLVNLEIKFEKSSSYRIYKNWLYQYLRRTIVSECSSSDDTRKKLILLHNLIRSIIVRHINFNKILQVYTFNRNIVTSM